MSVCNIRLGSFLNFDTEQEKDIIAFVERLNSTHSTGKFISNLFRIAWDCPEILKLSDNPAAGALLRKIDEEGMSNDRTNFFKNVDSNIAAMRAKVDAIYDMSYKMYMLALMGKHLKLEQIADNSLTAGFILEKQLRDIQNKICSDANFSAFKSDVKLNDVHKRAEDDLEYIIEAYTPLLEELRTMLTSTSAVPVQQVVQTAPVQSTPVQTVVAQPVSVQPAPVQNADKPMPETVKSVEVEKAPEDEVIDFGDDVMNSLESFFGG